MQWHSKEVNKCVDHHIIVLTYIFRWFGSDQKYHTIIKVSEHFAVEFSNEVPYQAKLFAKLFVGQNFRHQTRNLLLSPDEKFRPIKVKVSLIEVQMNLRGRVTSHSDKIMMIISSGENFSGEIFVGQDYLMGIIFVTFQKVLLFRPTNFHPIRSGKSGRFF